MRTSRWTWACLLLILLFTAAVRLRLLACPLERDEGEYAYAGQLLLEGVAPYKLAYNMKFPGVYGAYALLMALFGQTTQGIHMGLLLVNAASTLLVFLLARRIFGDGLASVGSAAAFALLSTSRWTLGFAGHATHFVVLPMLGGVLLLLGRRGDGRAPGRRAAFVAGLLMGLALLMKQPGLLFVLFGAGYLAAVLVRQGAGRSTRERARAAAGILALHGAGAALPLGLAAVLLALAGVFHRFWFWTVEYARAYGSEVPLSRAGETLRAGFGHTAGPSPALWFLAALGLLWTVLAGMTGRSGRGSAGGEPAGSRDGAHPRDSGIRHHRIFLLCFLAASFLAVCPGLYFRQHYFILMLPAAALLAGSALHEARLSLARFRGWPRRVAPALPALLLLLAVTADIVPRRETLFVMAPGQYCRRVYGENPFPESGTIARYIQEHSPKDARIAVLGSEPQIYFYAHRRSATGYIYTYGLMEQHPYASRMQEEMIREVTEERPEYLVFVKIGNSWLVRPGSERRIFDWAGAYIRENYDLAGVVEVPVSGEAVYRWDADAQGYAPRGSNVVSIFRRRKRAG